jgi:tRNA/tmRNA/rRNA uracil-C5-methylase (TrmA/RlmC/RlmD family)
MVISGFLLRMGNVTNKSCRESQSTHFVFSKFFAQNRAIYEKMLNDVLELGRPQMTIYAVRAHCMLDN